ncbi:MAG: DUF3244 domain-containing protein [Bacteroidales bacterium]|nr:DUF3244 domain-containing protein [Bacteroidales bacterium]
MKKVTKLIMLFGMLLPTIWCGANDASFMDGYTHIVIKEAGSVQGTPRGNTIEASINGHTLTIVFTQNIGHVTVEVATDTGTPVDSQSLATPDSAQFYITATGDYVFTVTLPNGDEYYGEFTVTD